MKILTGIPISLSLALAATLGVVGAHGQGNSSKKKPRQASSSSSTARKTRVRRVLANTEPGLPTNQTNANQAVEPANNNSIEPTEGVDTERKKQVESTATQATGNPRGKRSEEPANETSTADTKENNASPDSLTSLREQIEAAPSGPERIRLQLKLVEQLVAAS